MSEWTENELSEVEQLHPDGMTVQEIVDTCSRRGVRLTEATFRKYVQLGLLPRSVRVARKGKRRGSLGLYPVSAIRQLQHIRRLMDQGCTMDEIQRDFLFVRGDIDALERRLERVYQAFDRAFADRDRRSGDSNGAAELSDAKDMGQQLLNRLNAIERRLTLRARMDRAVV